jgi:DNA-binding GntR family transcriptional regulator
MSAVNVDILNVTFEISSRWIRIRKAATQGIPRIEARQNLTTLAYESIKACILRENLDAEIRLTEEFLSMQLGISRSRVRRALNSICTEGSLRIALRRGTYLQ